MRRNLLRRLVSIPSYPISERGEAGTKSWRLFLHPSGASAYLPEAAPLLSPWHDLPTTAADADPRLVLFVNEIPRDTNAKMELRTKEAHNPIGQDVHSKEPNQPLRFFRYGDMPFNYGFLPRTWESPHVKDARTGCYGDGDPIDVVELGRPAKMGEVRVVRVLGLLALIDQGETDWKLIAESVHPQRLNEGFGSMDKVPHEIQRNIVDWFVNYKTADGKPQNELGLDGRIVGSDVALEILEECRTQYDDLMAGKYPNNGLWLGSH